jgi:N4-(beta-N-acetylglucosaminyl)-L-asparaginase
MFPIRRPASAFSRQDKIPNFGSTNSSRMLSRKDFLKKTSLTALAGLTAPLIARAGMLPQDAFAPDDAAGEPLVIATWSNLGATQAAMRSLQAGGTALDAVEAGARVPEADPENMSVGYGGLPDRDGFVTLDACVMDHNGNGGSVTYLQHIMHPVSVARKVMEQTPHVMLSGDGALQFALSQGFKKENLLTDKARKAWEQWKKENRYTPVVTDRNHDTIGILAIDAENRLSGACTTSGWGFKMHGRVGDSPVFGAGLYVDNEVGGAAATGLGEFVLKTLGSFLVVELMRNGRSPQEAVEEAVRRITRRYDIGDQQVGYIAVNKKGEHGAFSIRNGFQYTLFRGGENTVSDAAFLTD